MTRPPLIAVMGPTAVGKTDLAIELALRLGGEVVTCDSVQVYQQMDIGSAKPTVAERRGVPHHMIDVVPAGAEYNAAHYAADASAVIDDITARGGIPIVAGGTGLYLRALLHGLIDAPGADPALRAELEAAEAATPGILRQRLEELDPAGAAAIEGNNIPRLIRDLEITIGAGEPVSAIRARHAFAPSRYPGARLVVLDADTAWIRARLDQREQHMLDIGLVAEIEGLWAAGVPREWRVWKAITYRQVIDQLEGRVSERALVPHMVQANVKYARRQRSWFRKEGGALWVRVDEDRPALDVVLAALDIR